MNLAAAVSKVVDAVLGELLFRAAVTGTSGNLVTIRRFGQTAADTQSYARLASYSTPTAGDEVLCLKVGSGVIVIGKVLR